MTLISQAKAFTSFSVDDLAAAKTFYGGTLGLEVKETPEGLELYLASGGMPVFIYPSDDYHAPEHTVLNFIVDDVDAAFDGLARLGIRMEHYDQSHIKTDAKGIFRNDSRIGPKAIAWFKDPAGHVLSILKL